MWLPPGGPFRPAPIQYEMLFILCAIFFTLRWLDSRRGSNAFGVGWLLGEVSLGVQTECGVYLAFASRRFRLVVMRGACTGGAPPWPPSSPEPFNAERAATEDRPYGGLHCSRLGMALPLLALLVYLVSNACARGRAAGLYRRTG